MTDGYHFFAEIAGGQWHRTETKGVIGGQPVQCACGISCRDPRVLKLRGSDDDSWSWVPKTALGACFPESMIHPRISKREDIDPVALARRVIASGNIRDSGPRIDVLAHAVVEFQDKLRFAEIVRDDARAASARDLDARRSCDETKQALGRTIDAIRATLKELGAEIDSDTCVDALRKFATSRPQEPKPSSYPELQAAAQRYVELNRGAIVSPTADACLVTQAAYEQGYLAARPDPEPLRLPHPAPAIHRLSGAEFITRQLMEDATKRGDHAGADLWKVAQQAIELAMHVHSQARAHQKWGKQP